MDSPRRLEHQRLDRAVRVLVIDDKAMPRIAVKAMLGGNPGFELVGEASSGSEGIRLIRALSPDVVLLDVDMPHMDGATTARGIFEGGPPHPKVLAWTVSDHGDDVIRMMRAGCSGFILKDSGPEELMHAIEAGLRGEVPIPRKLIPEIIARAVAPLQRDTSVQPVISGREMEVLRRSVRGQSTKDMARELGISPRSVDAHLNNLYRKLGVSSRGQAVHYALQRGLLSPESDTDN